MQSSPSLARTSAPSARAGNGSGKPQSCFSLATSGRQPGAQVPAMIGVGLKGWIGGSFRVRLLQGPPLFRNRSKRTAPDFVQKVRSPTACEPSAKVTSSKMSSPHLELEFGAAQFTPTLQALSIDRFFTCANFDAKMK